MINACWDDFKLKYSRQVDKVIQTIPSPFFRALLRKGMLIDFQIQEVKGCPIVTYFYRYEKHTYLFQLDKNTVMTPYGKIKSVKIKNPAQYSKSLHCMLESFTSFLLDAIENEQSEEFYTPTFERKA